MQRASWSLSTIAGWVICAILLGALGSIRHHLAIAQDEGLLGQSAERVLQGQWPHLDFDDTYTGGQAFFHAAVFRLLGTRSAALRDMLWVAAALLIGLFFAASSRYFGAKVAGVLTTLAVVWSFPSYFAPLPSWYNLIFAFFSWYFLTAGQRWRGLWGLGLAGFCCGLSVLFKIVGLYSFAAGLLAILYFDQTRCRPLPAAEPTPSYPSGPLRLLVIGGALAVTLGPWLVLHRGLTWTNALYFWAPIVAVVIPLILAENRPQVFPWQVRAARLSREVGAFSLGFLLPMTLFVGAYAQHDGGLAALFRGVFVLPQARFGLADKPLPPLFFLVSTGLPILGWVWWLGRRNLHLWQVLAFALLAGGLVWVSFPGNLAFAMVENAAFLLAPIGVGWAVWRLTRERDPELYALAAAVALFSLIQFPYTSYHYRAYTFPLVLLLYAFLLCRRQPAKDLPNAESDLATANGSRHHRWGLAVLAIFAYLYPIKWHHTSSIFSAGWHSAKDLELVPLLPERVGLELPVRDQVLYERIAEMVQRFVPPGRPILALPDAPHIYFFCERPNPTRQIYDALAAEPLSRDQLERLLAEVELVVVHHEPAFSPPLDPDWVRLIAASFPEKWQAGPYDIYYQRR